MKKSYKYQYQTYSIQLLMMEKKRIKKEVIPNFKLGNP